MAASSPRFSILIPTRDRPRTLAAALESVTSQRFGDYELVVMDNAGGPETQAVVHHYTTRCTRLTYRRTETLLSMNDNWEQGLLSCTGEFLFVLGDDDALMPDGLLLADQILGRLNVEVLHWDKYEYWWDDSLQPQLRGRLFLHQGHAVHMVDGHRLLADFFGWRVPFTALPCAYSSFVHRDLVARAKQHAGGRYFGVASPDIFSGMANAYLSSRIANVRRGLSLSGFSGKSTGSAHQFRSLGQRRQEEYWREEGRPRRVALHPALIDTPNLEVAIADSHFKGKQALFPDDDRFRPDLRGLIGAMLAGMTRDPASAADTLNDVRALCTKHEIPFDEELGLGPPLAAEPNELPPARLQQGFVRSGLSNEPLLVVNCAQAGFHDAAAVARLASAILPVVSYAA